MSNPKYIGLDVESGGTDPSKSLLTAYFTILDEHWEQIADLDLKIKPDNGLYIVEGEALRVNKIDLAKHDLEAITEKDAASAIYDFLWRVNGKKTKLIPVGHNVAFDIEFVCTHTLSKKSWDQFVGYRKLDTGGLALALMETGHLPADMNAGLGSLAKHFGVEFEAHTAKGDTWATIQVCKQMLALIRK